MRRVIVLLCGGMNKDARGEWHTNRVGEPGDTYAATNDYYRVEASALLAAQEPYAIIIVSGGKGQYENIADAPPVSSVLKRELGDLGVEESRIIEEPKSGTTFQQLRNIPDLLRELSAREVVFVTNYWHLPRTKAIFNYAPGIKDSYEGVEVSFDSAEDIIVRFHPDKSAEIESSKKARGMDKRIKMERSGTRAVIERKYEYK